eukprot:m.14348 g.14348  ORF g.14348 m.14348 type:complete len:793 (+) comp5067_c0_seq1:256-2634(+)
MGNNNSVQSPAPRIEAGTPGNGAPLLHGIRVVEMASVVAAPSVSRTLSDLGAEVVKVEVPPGDSLRGTLIQGETAYRKKKNASSVYESMGAGKVNVSINAKTNREDVYKLLEEADVFVTNIRNYQLERVGLRYEDIRNRFPHLIFAHITAWGQGPDEDIPGYDVGSFWSATGLSAQMQSEYNYVQYPIAFGDFTTGAGLVCGIAIALSRRATTGCGMKVENSLFRMGLFCNAPALLAVKNGHEIKPTKRVLDTEIPHHAKVEVRRFPYQDAYRTADYVHLALCGTESNASALAKALNIEGELTYESVKSTISKMQFVELESKLEDAKVLFVKQEYPTDFAWFGPKRDVINECFAKIEGIPDLEYIPAIPYEFSCSNKHGPRFPCARTGEHTESWNQLGWSDRKEEACLQRAAKFESPEKNAFSFLNDYVLVELSMSETSSIGAACKLLHEMCGISTVKLDASDIPNTWSQDQLSYAKHLDDGKEVKKCSLGDVAKILEAFATDGKKVIFATNVRQSVLTKHGLDHETLNGRIPEIVYQLVSPFGPKVHEDKGTELAAWFIGSPASCFFAGGKFGDLPTLPPQLGETVTSFYTAASIALALFHKVRTSEGNFAHISLLKSSSWSCSLLLPLLAADQTYDRMTPPELAKPMTDRERFGLRPPFFQNYKTKDGAWIMALGFPIPQTIKYLASFNIKYTAIGKLLSIISSRMLTFTPGGTLSHVLFGLASWNELIHAQIEQLTFEEFKTHAKQHDLWWAPILSAKEILHCIHPEETGSIVKGKDRIKIKCPVKMIP